MRFLKLISMVNLFMCFLVSNTLRIQVLQFSVFNRSIGTEKRRKKGASDIKTLNHQKRIVPIFLCGWNCGSIASPVTTERNMGKVTSHHQQSSLESGKQCDPLSCFISLSNSPRNSARTFLRWWEVKHSVLHLLLSIQDQLLKSQQYEHSSFQWCLLL